MKFIADAAAGAWVIEPERLATSGVGSLAPSTPMRLRARDQLTVVQANTSFTRAAGHAARHALPS